MTRWAEFPLRPQGQPWPGLNTRGGKLDNAMGQLEDGSVGSIINEADILEKRKGLIRGIDERFDGVVCGLFRYTDECGVEYVVVADQSGIKVRTPFDIPSFLGTDSLPNDDFEGDLDTTRWNNTGSYETFVGSLQRNVLSGLGVTNGQVEIDQLMAWFKESALSSYQVEIQYDLVVGGSDQVVAVAIKGSASAMLITQVFLSASGGYTVNLQLVNVGLDTRTTLATANLDGANLAQGFLRLSYNATSFLVTARVIPAGGDQVELEGQLNELQDSSLGGGSSIGIARADVNEAPQIDQVTGSSL